MIWTNSARGEMAGEMGGIKFVPARAINSESLYYPIQ